MGQMAGSAVGGGMSLMGNIGGAFSTMQNTEDQLAAYEKYNQPMLDYQKTLLPFYTEMLANYVIPQQMTTLPLQQTLATEYTIPTKEAEYQQQLGVYSPLKTQFSTYMQNRGFDPYSSTVPEVPELANISPELSNTLLNQQRLGIINQYNDQRTTAAEGAAERGSLQSGVFSDLLNDIDNLQMQDELSAIMGQANTENTLGRENTQWYNQNVLNRYGTQQTARDEGLRESMALLGMNQANPVKYNMPNYPGTETGTTVPDYGMMSSGMEDWGQSGSKVGTYIGDYINRYYNK